MKKRLTSLLIVLCLVLALVPTAMAASAADFTDVKEGTWYYDYVNEVVSKGYFKGESSTIFSPDKQMTRAMFVTVLSRVDGATVNDSKSTFDDVPVNQWYTGAVTWANENKIVLGTGGKNFEPNRAISRIDMCLIMSRYISYYAAKTGQVPATTSSGKTFSDISGLDAEAKAALDRCVTYGLIEGTPEGTFKPYDTATRAEVAAVISRLAWTTTGGGGVIPIVSSITYYQNQSEKDEKKETKTGTGSLHVLSYDSEGLKFEAPAGFRFSKWTENQDGSGKKYEVGESVTGVVTLYAQWELDTVDHINKAVGKAVTYANTEADSLYSRAFEEIENLLADTSVLADVTAFKEETTFNVALNDHTIDVTFKTDLSSDNKNLQALVQFAVDYAKEVYASDSTKQDVNQLAANIKEHLKEMLDRMEIGYSGDTMAQKLDTAAKNLAKRGKDKAVAYRDELKEIFKNVDLKNLDKVATANGTTSVLGVVVSANDDVLLEVGKDGTPTRADLEAAAQKAHEVVQTVSEEKFGGQYESIDEIADEITGKLVFTPADAIAKNYKAAGGDYDAEYTVKFHVTTGTGNYLKYKFEGGYDHFLFAPTQGMWKQYTNRLQGLKTRVADMLKGTSNAPSVNSIGYGLRSSGSVMVLSAPTAPIAPIATSSDEKMSLVDLIQKMDEAFKKVNGEQDKSVDSAMKAWKEANKDKITKDDMIDILLGEKELNTEDLENEAITDLIEKLVEDVAASDKLTEKGFKKDRLPGYTGEELENTLSSFDLSDYQDMFDAVEQFGMSDYMYAALADEFNKTNESMDQAKKEQVAADRTSKQGDLGGLVNDAIKDQVENPKGLEEFAESYLDVNIQDIIEEKFPDLDVNFDDIVKALDLFNDLGDPDKLSEKTLGGLVNEMNTDVIRTLAADRWENYSARVQSVFGRIDRLIDRLINTRYGDTIEGATIQIGENGGEMNVEDLKKKILEANYDTYNDLVSALNEFVNTTAKISDLSLGTLGETLITVHASNYTYSFYVEVDLSKAE